MLREEEIVVRDVTIAGLVVSDRISRDLSAQIDLEEALEAAKSASHAYSSHPREWPPLVEVVDTLELPPVLTERYNAAGGEGMALCGIFPELRRAWASVDNSLFLWRFDKWYLTEVRCLALLQSQIEAVYQGFRELEESLLSPFSFEQF